MIARRDAWKRPRAAGDSTERWGDGEWTAVRTDMASGLMTLPFHQRVHDVAAGMQDSFGFQKGKGSMWMCQEEYYGAAYR
jgi:hypothetical protein